jgi:hypothetical protein
MISKRNQHRHLLGAVLSSAALLTFSMASQAQIVPWTEAPGPLGLGYPVPIPVDTPLPFDGFRSYNGLTARHQDLAMTTPWVTGHEMGQTRQGRNIWLYQLGDDDTTTIDGRPEPAMLINGGIHAREWQSPEVTTGLIEYLATSTDDPLVNYLRDNVNGLVIPVLNIDGFLQTQRFPDRNYLGTNPTDQPDGQPAPRDGRMRRKNMLGVDEDLNSIGDHLFGVDLNRNNPPFWSTAAPNSSSFNNSSLVYHGASAFSEPETQALRDAANLGPAAQLRMFVDMHSFTSVFFSVQTQNVRRNAIQQRLLGTLTAHNQALPGNQFYRDVPGPIGSGIGLTTEYFAETYQVPSWTWEIEPDGAAGAQYGGLRSNGHDGFILPESEIRRVRENLAQSLATGFYHMAGPPSVRALEIFDGDTLAMAARWDYQGNNTRSLFQQQVQRLEVGKSYDVWINFDKPMRWRDEAGNVVPYPGQNPQTLDIDLALTANNSFLALDRMDVQWLNQAGGSPNGYQHYRDDAIRFTFAISDTQQNRTLLQQTQNAGRNIRFRITTQDFTGHQLDANPATVATFEAGRWLGYENNLNVAGDIGGTDIQLVTGFSLDTVAPAFLVEQGTSATWFDPSRDGEGIMLEVHPGGSSGLAWLTYDNEGNARWLVGIGEVRGNRILFPTLQVTSGGVFGPDFDPDAVVRSVAGSAELWFSGCDSGWFSVRAFGESARYPLARTSRTMGVDCRPPPGAISLPQVGQSGSWHDPALDGSGVNLQWLVDGRLGLLWFTYDPQGRQVYIFGTGTLQSDAADASVNFPELFITRGARFGAAFDPADVERIPWGSLNLNVNCSNGTLDYNSILPGFGSGQLQLERLTILAGLNCQDP